MKDTPIRVRIIYRRYKPLHENYNSFINYPPEGIEFIIPKPISLLSQLRPIYTQCGDNKVVQTLLQVFQKIFFDTASAQDTHTDVYHYLHMLPKKIPNKPFIVDLEHVAALANFAKPSAHERKHMLNTLSHPQCKKIIPLSNAAKKSLVQFFKEDFEKVGHKIEVVYPALPHYKEIFNEPDYSILTKGTFNILFVGQNPYGKGLIEAILAIQGLLARHTDIKLYIISKAPKNFIKQYQSDHILFYKWGVDKKRVITQFFMPADLFVLPTRGDTFGMVLLDALSSGTPAISTLQYAIPELIDEQENGFLLPTKYNHLDKNIFPSRKVVRENKTKIPDSRLVQQLASTIEMLYSDRKLLNTLAENTGREFSRNGKFSLNLRNHKLKQIYQAARGL